MHLKKLGHHSSAQLMHAKNEIHNCTSLLKKRVPQLYAVCGSEENMRQMHQLPYRYPIDHQNMTRYPTVFLQLISCLVKFDNCVVQS